ncbi:MAG: hypothetical protein Q8P67_27340, partial [archaeon]|nr:hypothetical protein [archaeon]
AQAEEAHQVAVAASERASADRDALAEELSSLRLLGDAHAVDLEAEKARLTQQLQEYQQQQEQSHQLEHRHQQENQQESSNMAELQSKFDTVSAENESLLARVVLLNEAGIQSQTALSTLQDQNVALNLELAELKTRTSLTLGDANTSLAAAQLSDLQEQLAATNQRLSQAEEAHQAAIAFAERASADRDALSEELSSLRLLSDSHEIATSSPALEQLQAQHDLLIAEKGHLLGEKDHLVAENQRLQEENSLLEAQQQQQQQSGHGAEHLLIQNQLEQRLQEQAAQLSGLQEQLAVTSQRLVLAEAAAADHSEYDPAALAEDARHAVATTTSPAVVTTTPPSPAIAPTLPAVEPSRSQYEQVASEKKVLRDIPLFTPPRPLPPTTAKQSPAKSNARKPASNSYRRDPSQPQLLPSPVQIQTELNLVLSKLSDTQVEAKTALDQLRVLKESLDMLTKDNLKKDILIKNYAVQANTGKLHSPDQALLQHQASGISSWFGSSHSAPSTIDPKSSDSGLMSALQNAMVKNIQDRDAIKGLSEDLERLVGENKALKTIITQLSQPSPTNA